MSFPAWGRRDLTLVPLFLVSLTSVGYEIALTRYFAVAEWSDYGYWVISIVMAGFALSGVAVALARATAGRHGALLLRVLPVPLILAAAIGFHFTADNPFNPLQLQNPVTWAGQLWNIGAYYAALLPFFFLAGLFVSLSFVLNSDRVGVVYAWDLTGAGLGAALVLALMYLLHPFRLVPALLVPLALSGALAGGARRWAWRGAAGLALVAAEALLLLGSQPRVNDFKPIYAPLHTPGARVVAERYSPRGVYDTLDDFTERVDTDVSNDAAMLGFPGPPRSFGLYRDGERIAALPMPGAKRGALDVRYAGAALDALPYALIAHPRVLLAGASGGFRVAEILKLGAARVVALEPEPVLLGIARAAGDPRVTVRGEGPLASARGGRYDIVDISADFLAAAPANASAFTVEALAAYLRVLSPDGVVSVPVSIRDFPVYALRVLATARAALLAAGAADPAAHVVVYRSAWNARVLLSKAPWDARRIAAVRQFCDQRSFDVSYYPGIDPAAARANLYNDLPAVSFANGEVAADGPDDSIADEAGAVLAGRPSASAATFSLAPMTLDRPFFFSALRLSDLGLLLRRLEVLPQAEIGALVNLAVLAQAVVIAAMMLLVPLAAGRRVWPERGGIGWVLLYFPALGLGFLGIEIFLIEQVSLWLGDRTSGFALVLTGMLIFSGLGSAVSGRFSGRPRHGVALAALVVVGWSVAVWGGLVPAILATLGAPWAVRAGLALLVMAPVSFALGLPFPLGLSRLGPGGALPWAWGLNGAFSVVATPLANLIAREAGFRLLLLGAAGLYAVAVATFPAARRRIQWLHLPARSHGVD